jgi:hypothetical protein
MYMSKKVGLLVALFAPLAPAFAQLLPGPIRVTLPPSLQSYLELSPAQVTAIQRLNTASDQFQFEKARRAAQVQFEIVQETAKTALDAMALGVRYLELEAIRRDIAADNEKTYAEIQKVLNDAQKTKVQALVAAMRLQSLICDAQAQNILPAASSANMVPFSPIVGVPSFASFLLSPTPALGLRGCLPAPLNFIGFAQQTQQ